mmetsp:Transcript_230/g.810  ORF Transcript_230/g.810 Transcript_230/m.810 type:complete len:223 (-) Transcript_230:24-692(-)
MVSVYYNVTRFETKTRWRSAWKGACCGTFDLPPRTKVLSTDRTKSPSDGLRGERLAAPALPFAIRVVEHEFCLDSVFHEVQLRPDDVHKCRWFDQELHAELLDLFVELSLIFRVVQGIRFPVATFRFHTNAQVLGFSLVQQRANAFCSCFGEFQHLFLRSPPSCAGHGRALCSVFCDLCPCRGPPTPRLRPPRPACTPCERQCASHGLQLPVRTTRTRRPPT